VGQQSKPCESVACFVLYGFVFPIDEVEEKLGPHFSSINLSR
jgi:hypothetical protein